MVAEPAAQARVLVGLKGLGLPLEQGVDTCLAQKPLRGIMRQLPTLQRLSNQQRPSQELIRRVFFFSSINWPLI